MHNELFLEVIGRFVALMINNVPEHQNISTHTRIGVIVGPIAAFLRKELLP